MGTTVQRKAVYGLEIKFNQNDAVRCFSEPGGILVYLTTRRGGGLKLEVNVKRGGRKSQVLLSGIVPEDTFEFRYLMENRRTRNSTNQLSKYSRRRVLKEQKGEVSPWAGFWIARWRDVENVTPEEGLVFVGGGKSAAGSRSGVCDGGE